MAKAAKKDKIDMHDGGVFLVVADQTEEFILALRYAAEMAKIRKGRVGILYALEPQGFQHWGSVEAQIRKEHREAGEKFLWEMARHVLEVGGAMPAFYLREGSVFEALIETMEEDKSIKRLTLATSNQPGNPGPLISHFTGKALLKLPVPLVIVPGHFTLESIEAVV